MDFIKEHWESQAKKHGDSYKASWGDNYMIDLEIETIGKYLADAKVVLDGGCGNGFSAFRQIERQASVSVVGIDFSEAMVAEANGKRKNHSRADRIQFEVGDIRRLRFKADHFDVVYTTRVLINLPTWDEQKQAIGECLRVVKPGGTVVLSEAFWEPLALLNAFRLLKQLPPLVEHDFNRYLKKSKLESYLKESGVEYVIDDFSSIYYLGSRFVRELVTDISQYQDYTNPINKLFFEIEKEFSGGGCGIQQAYILRK